MQTRKGAEPELLIHVGKPRFRIASHRDALAGRKNISIAESREIVRVQKRVV